MWKIIINIIRCANKNNIYYNFWGEKLTNISEISGFIWGIADSVLRGTYRRNEYQKVILPFTVLKRFDSVLEYSKKDVVDTYEANKSRTGVLAPILMSKAVDEVLLQDMLEEDRVDLQDKYSFKQAIDTMIGYDEETDSVVDDDQLF